VSQKPSDLDGLIARRDEPTDREWTLTEPLLPNKPRRVARVDDRRVLNGSLWRLRPGAALTEVTERYGRSATCYNRFVRWRKAGVGPAAGSGFCRLYGELVVIASTCMHVHQNGVTGKKAAIVPWDVPGGLTSKLHALADADGCLVSLRLTAGQIDDACGDEALINPEGSEVAIRIETLYRRTSRRRDAAR